MTDVNETNGQTAMTVRTPERRLLGRERPLFKEVSLDKMEERLAELEEGNHDLFVPAGQINITPDGLLQVGAGDDAKLFSFTDWSFSQVAKFVGIPSDTLSKSPLGTGKASRKSILDYWLDKKKDHTVCLRLKDLDITDPGSGASGKVRAFLPGDTVPYSNRELLTSLRPYFSKYDMAVQIGAVTEKTLHIRSLFREAIDLGRDIQTENTGLRADLHNVGVHWRNSEVGFSSLQADLLVFRVVCTNGMIALTEKNGLFHKQHRFIDPATITIELGQVMIAARERQSELLEGLRILRDRRFSSEEETKAAMVAFLTRNGASQKVIQAVKDAWDKEPIRSPYGILQAMTRGAQQFAMDGGRTDIETLAGKYLADTVTAA
jgi:hypothetical protein